jgi:outer membrane protein assembly factor BamB
MPPRLFLLAPALLTVSAAVARADDWPQFRGPTGQGHYAGKPLPLEWAPDKNVAWKQPLPGRGWSSPVVCRGRVYLTTALETPAQDQDAKGREVVLQALALDALTGKQLWQTDVFRVSAATTPRIHAKNSHASPTPVTDGKRLFVHFGHQGTACLDLDGNVLWRNSELGYAPVHGNGGSPVLVDDRLVFAIDGSDMQVTIALDASTGKEIWKTDRKSTAVKKFSFCTPLLIEMQGRRQIVSPASDAVIAYDPRSGAELWRVKYQGYSVVPRPVFGHGLVFLSTGYDRPKLLAIRADGTGDVTDSHVAWALSKGAPHTPSPLLVGDELYVISDLGIAHCLDARTGKVHWEERLEGNYSASPLHADGRICFQTEDGVTYVVRTAKKFELLAENRLEEKTLASFAAADGAIHLRTESHLYRIAAQE